MFTPPFYVWFLVIHGSQPTVLTGSSHKMVNSEAESYMSAL